MTFYFHPSTLEFAQIYEFHVLLYLLVFFKGIEKELATYNPIHDETQYKLHYDFNSILIMITAQLQTQIRFPFQLNKEKKWNAVHKTLAA